MIKLFREVVSTDIINSRKKLNIDNIVSKLHYRVTTIGLLLVTGIICAQDLIGEKIHCFAGKGSAIDSHTLNNYCYTMGTYSVPSQNPMISTHPGINPDNGSSRLYHLYYQWVPFFLVFLATTFYVPRWFTKLAIENDNCSIFKNIIFKLESFKPKDDIPNETMKLCVKLLKIRMRRNNNYFWCIKLILIEIFSFCNVFFVYYLTQVFIDRDYFLKEIDLETVNMIFPMMSKCSFYTFGSSGSVQYHDALCTLTRNIINRKLFWLLQYWFSFLIVMTLLAILWRFFSTLLHTIIWFNKIIMKPVTLNKNDMKVVFKKISWYDWMFLKYLFKNVNSMAFEELFAELAKEFHNDFSILSEEREETDII